MWELSLYSITLNQQYYDDFTSEEDDSSLLQGLTPPKVAVLTARAEEFKAALEIKDESKLAQAFLKTGESSEVCPTKNWGVGPVLYGSVNEWIVQYKKGLRKFNNFERLLEQDPTGRILQVCRCDCVVSCPLWSISFALSLTLFCPLAQYTTTHFHQYIYVGDTGELDQEAGETMLREYPEVVQAVFLHVVSFDSPSAYPSSGLPIPPSKLINGRPLVFFRTYVGAAAKATQLGLMEGDGLMRVMEKAEKELEERGVPKDDVKWIDLERDIYEAHRTIETMV